MQIGLNYEAGSERSPLHGDDTSEGLLADVGLPGVPGMRSMLLESSFEFGSRRGAWRLLRIFEERDIKISFFTSVYGLAFSPEPVQAFAEAGHEFVGHCWRWIDYQHVPEDEEREHIKLAIDGIKDIVGRPPVGWMSGRPSPNTRKLLIEHGGLLYDRDALNDELPYWVEVGGKSHLVIPYSYETNDNRSDLHAGFATSEHFFQYMKDTFDVLYAEGADEPKMMSLGLHDRLTGRPGRAAGLIRFLDYVQSHDKVWICTGEDIARHWIENHPAP